jgi:hypothetical protein
METKITWELVQDKLYRFKLTYCDRVVWEELYIALEPHSDRALSDMAILRAKIFLGYILGQLDIPKE